MTSPATASETASQRRNPSQLYGDCARRNIRSVLLLGSSLSGATGSIMAELKARGFQVHRDRASLRRLKLRPLFIAAIVIEAILTYGPRFRRYLMRTRAANWAYGFASERTLKAYGKVDLVVQIGANHLPYLRSRRPGVAYTVYTDHSNILSKQLPSFGLDTPERRVSATWNKLERENLALQDHVFVMGSQVKRSMVSDYLLPERSVSAVGAGPNLDIDIERDGFQKDARAKNILFVGLQPQRKGLPALLAAFAQVRKFHRDAALHVVGVEGASADGVTYYGRLRGAALKQRFYESQVFVMPSLREPFGMVFLEAMWAKAVCIGTRIGAIPEIIEDGRSGFVVEPNDVDALAERIIRLFDQPETRRRFAERAYAQAQRRWSWAYVVDEILKAASDVPLVRPG